jgi:hypothetical protein
VIFAIPLVIGSNDAKTAKARFDRSGHEGSRLTLSNAGNIAKFVFERHLPEWRRELFRGLVIEPFSRCDQILEWDAILTEDIAALLSW